MDLVSFFFSLKIKSDMPETKQLSSLKKLQMLNLISVSGKFDKMSNI